MADSASSFVASVGGRSGNKVSIASADPAAGAELTYTVPTGKCLRLDGVRIALVTDATVANRRPTLQIKDDLGVVQFEINTGVDQAASLTWTYTFAAGLGFAQTTPGAALKLAIGIPKDLYLPAGWVICTSTTAIVAGDNYGIAAISGVLFS